MNDIFNVNIITSGTFYGQTFYWNHPYKNVNIALKTAPNKESIFYGYRHHDFNNLNGIDFFMAFSKVTNFKKSNGYTGYGSISVEGLIVKYYGSAVVVTCWEDTKPTAIKIANNTFYKIGQIVNPEYWTPRYSAITIENADGAVISNNLFMKNENTLDANPEYMHGVYLKRSDKNTIENNQFESISGEPVKVRDGSDHNIISNNSFTKGPNSTHIFPVQNWYDNWYVSDEDLETTTAREIPSLGNKLDNNQYLGGYISDVITTNELHIEQLCDNRTIASPNVLPQSYIDATEREKTSSRFIINGSKRYHTHWYALNCERYY